MRPSTPLLPFLPPPLQELVNLLLVMSQADGVVKGFVCTKDNLQQLLECLGRVQPPHLVKVSHQGGGGTKDNLQQVIPGEGGWGAATPVGVTPVGGVPQLGFWQGGRVGHWPG